MNVLWPPGPRWPMAQKNYKERKMKFRNIIVMLLTVLMVFAAVSCKQDPEPPVPEYTVTFDSQGGSEVSPATVKKDALVAKPADPRKGDMVFKGWFKEAACTTEYDFSAPVTQSFTLYAKWVEPVRYTITFVSGGSAVEPISVIEGKIAERPENPTKEGYLFKGWYEDAEGTTAYRFNKPVTAAMTLYGQWLEEGSLYQVEVYEGVDKDYWNRDKIKFEWDEEVEEGDVITLKYRSERDVYQWDIRNGDHKWVYENDKNGFVDPVLGEDGWYLLTYTLGKTIKGEDGASDAIGVYFRGNYVTTDIFEIKEITLNGVALEIEQDNIASKAYLTGTEEHPYIDHDWTVKNYTVLFAKDKVGEKDKTPIAEKVIAGGLVTGAPVYKEGYTLKIFNDYEKTQEFDPLTPIYEEKIFYYEYIGVPRTVKLVAASPLDDVIVPNGDLFVSPVVPPKGAEAFKAWYKDEALTTEWNMADPVISDITLYAKYAEGKTVTFDSNGGSEVASQFIAVGNTATQPENPTYDENPFLGWFTDNGTFENAYDFSAPVTENITLYANWGSSQDFVDITLIDGESTSSFKILAGTKLAEDDERLAVEKIPGYAFDGWFDDAEGKTPHNFEAAVTEDLTLYALWSETPLYQMVSKHATSESYDTYDKFAIEFGKTAAGAGDVLSFRYRSTTPISFYNVRNGSIKWIYQQPKDSALPECFVVTTDVDGWTYVTYTFTEKDYEGKSDIPKQDKFSLHFGAKTFEIGDILEVQDITFNGKLLTIKTGEGDADGVVSVNTDTASIVEPYDWEEHTVTFEMNGGTPELEPVTVDFGGKVDEPDDPIKLGALFAGWFSDEDLTKEFNFATPIIDDITIYAKWGEGVTITFSGTDLEPVTILKGTKLEEPADPKKEGYVFDGWYADSEFAAKYDFDSEVNADLTIYAKWLDVWAVTLNLNDGKGSTKTVYAGKGAAIDAVDLKIGRPGYFFDGWFKDSALTEAFDPATLITENTNLYAKWSEPDKYYTLTSTVAEKYSEGSSNYTPEYFQFRWRDSYIKTIEAGDVITFMVRFYPIETSSAPDKMIIMDKDSKEYYNGKIGEADSSGWIPVSFTIEKAQGPGIKLRIKKSSGNIAVNDQMEIKAIAINGKELGMQDDNTKNGIYEGCRPTLKVNSLEPTAPTVYVLTMDGTGKADRVQLAFPEGLKPGDTVSFKYQTNLSFTNYGVRTKNSGDYCKNVEFVKGDPDEGNWYTFSYTIPDGKPTSTEFFITLNCTVAADDVLKIKQFTVAGKDIAIAASNNYSGAGFAVTTE